MASLTVQDYGSFGSGITLVAADETNGDTFRNEYDGVICFRVKNNGAVVHNITVVASRASNQGVLHDLVLAVPADGAEYMTPPLPAFRFGRVVSVTYDAGSAADLVVNPVKLGDLSGVGVDPTSGVPALGAAPTALTLYDESVLVDGDFVPPPADGVTFENRTNTILIIKNADTADHRVYVLGLSPSNQGFNEHELIAVPAGSTVEGEFMPRTRFGGRGAAVFTDASDVVDVTGITVAAVLRSTYKG